MSSMLPSGIKSGLLFAGVAGLAASSQMTQQQVQWYKTALTDGMPQSAPGYIQSDEISNALVEWKRLQQSDNLPFSDYANFLLLHPNWPGDVSRRAAAETVLDSGTWAPGLVVRFFEKYPPLTAAGNIRFAEALAASGQQDRANAQAKIAWRKGVLRPGDEAKLIGAFSGVFTPADHDAREDMLLWQGQTSAAQRQLSFTSLGKRPLFEARIAYRSNAADASTKGDAVFDLGRGDPGYIADRATWLRNNNQGPAARAYLGQPHSLTTYPANPEKWYEVLLTAARGAQADGQYDLAYRIASQVDDAYPPGTDVGTKSLGERDDYTSLTWLAGTVALQQLGRARDAASMFDRYSRGSKTPTTQSKGAYWAGKASETAGDQAAANAQFERAAGFPDLYYGQLATEHLGRPLRRPPDFNAKVTDPAIRDAFYKRETVRAVQLLGTMGDYETQGYFIRQIAKDATSDSDHILSAELSRVIGRPDLGVMVGRSALQNGLSDYTAAGYPSVRVPAVADDNWTIVHAIARQESQFDRAAVSHAGARGLMQLMPGTAADTSRKLGLAYNREALTQDTDYNIQLGSSYFSKIYNLYGSYPLAVAAYNAGPGNVNKWLAAYGDPRTGRISVVDWVEKIPIFETKNYVQRVLENAVVYDLLNPTRARSSGPANLSWYLGKRPG